MPKIDLRLRIHGNVSSDDEAQALAKQATALSDAARSAGIEHHLDFGGLVIAPAVVVAEKAPLIAPAPAKPTTETPTRSR